MVASVQVAMLSNLEAAVQSVPPRPPSKAAIAKFETALQKPEEAKAPALGGHAHGIAVQTTPGVGEKLVEVGNKFNNDYKKVFRDDLQKLLDHDDPNDPHQFIREAEFAISMQQANLQLTMVAGIADSSKKSLHELLKNQG
jgi:hypothetical protein